MSEHYDPIVADYCFPLPVHLDNSRVIVRNPDEATAMLRLQRTAFVECGVIALTPSVTAMDLPRKGRFRIWVDWHELTVSGHGPLQSKVIYYCRQTPTGFKIEMVDYTRLSMPELQTHFAALALSA
jgi:hypothetical protein